MGLIYTLTGPSIMAVRVVQCLLGALACVMMFDGCRHLFNLRVGLWAGVLLAIFPVAVFFDLIIQKSGLDSFLVCLMVMAIGRLCARQTNEPESASATKNRSASICIGLPWVALLGLGLGLFVLNRENGLPLIPLLAGWLVYRQHRLSRANSFISQALPQLKTLAAFALGIAIVLSPVLIRNKAVGGEFHLTTSQFGPNFYIGNNPNADGSYQPLRFGRSDAMYERQDATDLAEEALGRKLSPAQVSDYWRDKAFDFITDQPVQWLKLMGKKTLLAFNSTEMGDTEDLYTWADYSLVLRLLCFFHVGLLLPLVAVGIVLSIRQYERLLPLYMMALIYMASVIGFYVFARYRYPGLIMLIPFAALALAAPWRAMVNQLGAKRALTPALSAAGIVLVLTNLPLASKPAIMSASRSNLGTYFAMNNDPGRAIIHLVKAVELNPSMPDGYFNLALFYLNNQRPDLAAMTLEEGLRAAPGHPELLRLQQHVLQVIAGMRQNQPDESPP
jgi:4-amino-4-deoxy-L-arabinose transferase-like glycosyltransferase